MSCIPSSVITITICRFVPLLASRPRRTTYQHTIPRTSLTLYTVPRFCLCQCAVDASRYAVAGNTRYSIYQLCVVIQRPHTISDGSKPIEINCRGKIYTIVFTEDGKQVLSGGDEGFLRQWQVDDGREIEDAIQVDSEGGAEISSAALSPDRERLVCGLRFPKRNNDKAWVGVWDMQTRKKVLDIYDHTDTVVSVDVSPDLTRFATGSGDQLAFIWSITTGERLVGPLRHDGVVATVRFSPSGDRLATAVFKNPGANSIRIYKSDSGQQLLDLIPFAVQALPASGFIWSADGHQLFAVALGEVKCFDASSGALLSKWSVHGGTPSSIALAHNQKFVVVSEYDSLSFWDPSTHKQIGTVIKQANVIWSMALSSNDDRVAIGEENGKIVFRSLCDIIPCSYFTANVSSYTWQSHRIL